MAWIYVTEYAQLARSLDSPHVMAGQEPAITDSRVAIGGGSLLTAAFSVNTKFIMVHTDAICAIKIDGLDANGDDPIAVATSHRMAAGETRFYGVVGGQKLAVITAT